MSANTIYLVTGANRGIGRGLVEHLLTRPNTTIIAATRDPSTPTSQSLLTVPRAPSTSIHLIQIESTSETSAHSAIQTLAPNLITKIDVVIANSGIYEPAMPVLNLSAADLRKGYEINTIAPLLLFQATYALLMKAEKPRFVAVSSQMGSLALAETWDQGVGAYGSSKAALNFLVRRIHRENKDKGLIAFPIHPGWVQTDMGNRGAKNAGLKEAPTTIAESVEGIMKEIDEAEMTETAPFLSFEHTGRPW